MSLVETAAHHDETARAEGESLAHALELMQLAQAGEALASEAVQRAARTRFSFSTCAHAPALRVGGARVAAYVLEAAAAIPDAHAQPCEPASSSSILVGRDAELARLQELVEASQRGASQLVVLTGTHSRFLHDAIAWVGGRRAVP